jgi:hypothetical protein
MVSVSEKSLIVKINEVLEGYVIIDINSNSLILKKGKEKLVINNI